MKFEVEKVSNSLYRIKSIECRGDEKKKAHRNKETKFSRIQPTERKRAHRSLLYVQFVTFQHSTTTEMRYQWNVASSLSTSCALNAFDYVCPDYSVTLFISYDLLYLQ